MRIFPPPDSSVDVDWFQASLNLSDNVMVSADGHTYEHRRRGGQSWRVGRSADREPIVLRVYVLRDRKPHRERLILSMPLPLPLPLPRMALGTNPFVICRPCTPTKQAAPAGLRPKVPLRNDRFLRRQEKPRHSRTKHPAHPAPSIQPKNNLASCSPFCESNFVDLRGRAVRRCHQTRRREGVERYRRHCRVGEDQVGQRGKRGVLVFGGVGVVVAVSNDSPVELLQKNSLGWRKRKIERFESVLTATKHEMLLSHVAIFLRFVEAGQSRLPTAVRYF